MGMGFGKLDNKLTDEWNVKLSPLTYVEYWLKPADPFHLLW